MHLEMGSMPVLRGLGERSMHLAALLDVGVAWPWWHRWPSWWHTVNDIGQITWKITLEPGEKKQLQYEWYYYAW